ncbi:MAG: TRAP transporter small permease [Jhaorihella sp.]
MTAGLKQSGADIPDSVSTEATTGTRVMRVLDRIAGLIELACVAVLIIMMLHVVADVAVKYAGFAPLFGTTEIVSYWYMPVIAFLPLAVVERSDNHIKADLIEQIVPKWFLRFTDIAAHLLSTFFFAMFATVGWEVAEEKREIGSFVMGVDAVVIWPTYYMIPIGCGCMAFAVLIRLYGRVSALRLARKEPYSSEDSDR